MNVTSFPLRSLLIRSLSGMAASVAIVVMSQCAEASLAASDSASAAAYTDGWQSGDNGGSGWGGEWTLSTTSGNSDFNGHFVGSSESNGATDLTPDSDINTTAGRAWGLYANSTHTASAERRFSGALLPGQTFSISMDNGFLNNPATVGFSLQNDLGQNLFEFYFQGGASNYTVAATPTTASPVLYTDQGLRLTFLLTTANSFSLAIDSLSNGPGVDATVSKDLITQIDMGISRVRLFNNNAGSGDPYNAYFNSIAIAVPEASSFVFGGLACCFVAFRSRGLSLIKRLARGR